MKVCGVHQQGIRWKIVKNCEIIISVSLGSRCLCVTILAAGPDSASNERLSPAHSPPTLSTLPPDWGEKGNRQKTRSHLHIQPRPGAVLAAEYYSWVDTAHCQLSRHSFYVGSGPGAGPWPSVVPDVEWVWWEHAPSRPLTGHNAGNEGAHWKLTIHYNFYPLEYNKVRVTPGWLQSAVSVWCQYVPIFPHHPLHNCRAGLGHEPGAAVYVLMPTCCSHLVTITGLVMLVAFSQLGNKWFLLTLTLSW